MLKRFSLRNARLVRWIPIIGKKKRDPLVLVVRLDGVIAAHSRTSKSLNIGNLAPVLERAFSTRRAVAVAFVINSPGGSPAQSSLIADRIRALAKDYDGTVYAFVEDVAASGGYWLACAADEIYANSNSIVGSIGVLYSGFGFHQLLERFGIERRVFTAGDKKTILDPFSPLKDSDLTRLKSLQKGLHENFRDYVRERRGTRLTGSSRTLFSGEFWTGEKAQALGLIDGIGDVRTVMQEKFGESARLKVIQRRTGLASLGGRLWSRHGYDTGDLAENLVAQIEERIIWNRFGL